MNAVLPAEADAPLPSRWRSVLLFAAFSTAWFVSSDALASVFAVGSQAHSLVSTGKGLLYIAMASIWLALQLGRRADLIERMAAELAQAADRHRQTLDLLPDALLLTVGTTICYANPAACRLFRTRRASELVGRSTLAFIAPEQHVLARVRVEAMQAGETLPEQAFTLVRLDGSRAQVMAIARPLEGQESGIQIVLRDQTHALNLAKRLQDAEARYRAVLDLSRTAIVIAALDTGIVNEANAQAGVLFRRPAADLIGLHITELAVAAEREHCLAMFRGKEARAQLLSLQHADGTEVMVHMRAMPIKAGTGQAARSILIEMSMPNEGSAVVAHDEARPHRAPPLLVTKRLTKMA